MKRMFAWLLLLGLLCGCAPAEQPEAPGGPDGQGAGEQRPAAVENPPAPVYADWSKLPAPEQGQVLCRQYWGEPQQELKPDGGYGTLLPYRGEELHVITALDGDGWDRYRYGLATAEGLVAVEPVYDGVYPLYLYREDRSGGVPLPVYVLEQTQRGEEADARLIAVAARDGSWCTEARYTAAYAVGEERLLLIDRDGGSWFCDLRGRVTAAGLKKPVAELWGPWWKELMGISSETVCMSDISGSGCRLADFESGLERYLPEVQYCSRWLAGSELAAAGDGQRNGYLDRQGNWAIAPQYETANEFQKGLALVRRGTDDPWQLIDRQGNPVLTFPGASVNMLQIGEALYYLNTDADSRILGICDAAGNQLEHPAVGGTYRNGWPMLEWLDGRGTHWCWNGREAVQLPAGFRLSDAEGDLAVLQQETEDWSGACGAYSLGRKTWILPPEQSVLVLLRDTVTDEVWLMDGYGGGTVWDQNGEKLFSAASLDAPADGVFSVQSGVWTGLMNRDGEWLLRRCLQTAND